MSILKQKTKEGVKPLSVQITSENEVALTESQVTSDTKLVVEEREITDVFPVATEAQYGLTKIDAPVVTDLTPSISGIANGKVVMTQCGKVVNIAIHGLLFENEQTGNYVQLVAIPRVANRTDTVGLLTNVSAYCGHFWTDTYRGDTLSIHVQVAGSVKYGSLTYISE